MWRRDQFGGDVLSDTKLLSSSHDQSLVLKNPSNPTHMAISVSFTEELSTTLEPCYLSSADWSYMQLSRLDWRIPAKNLNTSLLFFQIMAFCWNKNETMCQIAWNLYRWNQRTLYSIILLHNGWWQIWQLFRWGHYSLLCDSRMAQLYIMVWDWCSMFGECRRNTCCEELGPSLYRSTSVYLVIRRHMIFIAWTRLNRSQNLIQVEE